MSSMDDGAGPRVAGLHTPDIDRASGGGANANGGNFKMTPTSGGAWTESIYFTFDETDGNVPQSGVVIDAKFNFYGTTEYGGASLGGTAFEIVP